MLSCYDDTMRVRDVQTVALILSGCTRKRPPGLPEAVVVEESDEG